MANYGYIFLQKPITPEVLEQRVREAVLGWFGDRMEIKLTPQDDYGPVWYVFIPGTALDRNRALTAGKAVYEDFGFPVALQDKGLTIAFRHGLNAFESWLQGCIEEQLSEALGVGVFYDATSLTYKPGARYYRCRKRFGLYVARNLKKPLTREEQEFVDRYKPLTPEGWW